MIKEELHLGEAYGYRKNSRTWEKAEDSPSRVRLVDSIGSGKYIVEFDDGSKIEARSRQLIVPWDESKIQELLESERSEREFRKVAVGSRLEGDAAEFTIETVAAGVYIHSKRAWLSPAAQRQVEDAAGLEIAIQELSSVSCFDSEGNLCLPLPAAIEIAKSIANRDPGSIETAVSAKVEEMRAEGRLRYASMYSEAWNLALEWAGKPPVKIPSSKLDPTEAFNQMFERLRGRGVEVRQGEYHAWGVSDQEILDIGHLLASATEWAGRFVLESNGDGSLRISIGRKRERTVLSDDEASSLASSLSAPQARMLSIVRAAGRGGLELPRMQSERRTLESLCRERLAHEREDVSGDSDLASFALTDLGWRVVGLLELRET